MSIDFKDTKITMELFETDICELQKFITSEKIEEEFSKRYLILYNFASDCKYSKYIQYELIMCLLPFYLKTIEHTFANRDRIAMDIYDEFNSAIFLNKNNFVYAVGEANYRDIMNFYIDKTINRMEKENAGTLQWISTFNTTIALHKDNIALLFEKIFHGSLKLKYEFFKYLSILLFKESDNLIISNVMEKFWTSNIWDFDSTCAGEFFWSNDAIEYFDNETNREKIEYIFGEIKPLLCDFYGAELIEFFTDEMQKSFNMGIFEQRKIEFLEKISSKHEIHVYWNETY